MARYRFCHNGLMCDVYEPKRDNPSGCALFLYGFPATIGENAATEFLLKAGLVVLQPHYPGTYDSAGDFTPESATACIRSLVAAVEVGEVRDLKNNSQRRVPQKVLACVGYSFGCLVGLRALPILQELRLLLLASPAITYGDALVPSGFRENGPAFLDYVRRTRPFTYRLGDERSWHLLYDGHLNEKTGVAPATLRSVVGVVGSADESFDIGVLRKNFTHIIQSYVGEQPLVELVTVEGAGHSISSLLTPSTNNHLEAKLSEML